jgi:hypothetical protein
LPWRRHLKAKQSPGWEKSSASNIAGDLTS